MRRLSFVWPMAVVSAVAFTIGHGVAQQAPQTPETGFTDTPLVPGLPYHVHDPARPRPVVVAPGAMPGQAPSDAVVLFDGKDLSKWSAVKFGTAAYTQSDA